MDPHFSLEANHGPPPFSGTDFPGVFENQAEENHACLRLRFQNMPVSVCAALVLVCAALYSVHLGLPHADGERNYLKNFCSVSSLGGFVTRETTIMATVVAATIVATGMTPRKV